MTNVSISIANTLYNYSTSITEQAGLDLAWQNVMSQLPPGDKQDANTAIQDRPGYVNSSALYLQNTLAAWANANPSGNVSAMMAQCIQSWDLSPPQVANVVVNTVSSNTAPLPSVLMSYAAAKADSIAQGGITVDGIPMPTDTTNQGLLTGAFILAQSGAANSFNITTQNGFIVVNTAVISDLAIKVGLFVKSVQDATANVFAQINSNTITTAAQIDSFNWPQNS